MSALAEKNAAALEIRRTVVHRAEQMFAKMREIVERPGSCLQYFQADFYSHDRNYLVATHAMGKYLWVVRESGTELKRIGVSKKDHVVDSLKGWEEGVLATEYAFADFHRAAGLPLADPYDGAGVIIRDGITLDAVLVRIAEERERVAEALREVGPQELAAEPALSVM